MNRPLTYYCWFDSWGLLKQELERDCIEVDYVHKALFKDGTTKEQPRVIYDNKRYWLVPLSAAAYERGNGNIPHYIIVGA